jgi:hypothetical protein
MTASALASALFHSNSDIPRACLFYKSYITLLFPERLPFTVTVDSLVGDEAGIDDEFSLFCGRGDDGEGCCGENSISGAFKLRRNDKDPLSIRKEKRFRRMASP